MRNFVHKAQSTKWEEQPSKPAFHGLHQPPLTLTQAWVKQWVCFRLRLRLRLRLNFITWTDVFSGQGWCWKRAICCSTHIQGT
jgi:hypothetical protein